MRMLRKIVFATLIFAMASATAMACDCVTRSGEESFANADYVFIGKMIGSIANATREDTNFEVSRWLKGYQGERVVISNHLSNCDVLFFDDYTYIVYAKNINGELMASTCSGTRVIGKLPVQGCANVSVLDNTERSYREIAVITASSVALSLTFGVLVGAIKRRFKK